jgi:hypothetical protein
MAVEFIVMKGIEFAKAYTVEKEVEVEAFIKNILPGTDFDDLGWGIVKSLMPRIFEIAETLCDKIDGTEDLPTRHAMILAALRSAA